MKLHILILLAITSFFANAQDATPISQDIAINQHINGTLLKPNTPASTLAIIIGGSGPTDKDGNQNFQKTNNIKKLATHLANQNIATFRYDKRIVKQIRNKTVANNIMFDDFVADASAVMTYFKSKNNYKHIYIIGHDQGSLIGMLAAKDAADGFISIAGTALSIDQLITEQVEKTAPQFTADTKRIFKLLKAGKTTTDYPVALSSIFNIETQRFIMNWMQYNPTEILSTLEIPILITNGTKDLQVSEAEAKLLHDAAPTSELKIIPNMNHVLVTISGGDLENSKSYNESQRPLSPELLNCITTFINH